MRTRAAILLFFPFLLVLRLHSQNGSFVGERVYLAPALTQYSCGDTVQVSGQALSYGTTSFYPLSRYVYVELIDTADSVRVRKKVRCDTLGVFRASIPLPENIDRQICRLRGYTQFMLCDTTYHYPEAVIKVGIPASSAVSGGVKASFFPEGGALTAGKGQRVAVWLCDNGGAPVQAPFLIRDDEGTVLQQDTTSASGFGIFTYAPEGNGKTSVLEVTDGEKTHRFLLPAPASPVALQAAIHGRRVYCSVCVANEDSLFKYRLFIYHPLAGRKELSLQNGTSIVDLGDCPSGVVTLWLLDETGRVAASRVLWLPQGETDIGCKVSEVCQTGKLPEVALSDTLPGSRVMMRIAPLGSEAESHAFETLCLLGELASPVPFPSAFYRENAPAARNDLEAWLYTARPVRLQQMAADSISYPYAIEQGILLTGKVTVVESRKTLPHTKLLLLNTRTYETYSTETDSEGRFSLFVNDFQEDTPFFIQVVQRKEQEATYAFLFDGQLCPPVNQSALPFFAKTLAESTPKEEYNAHFLHSAEVRARRPYRPEFTWKERHIEKSPFYYVSAKDIERKNFLTVEEVLRKLQKVQVSRAEKSKHHPMRGESGNAGRPLLPEAHTSVIAPDDDETMNFFKVVKWTNSSRYEGFMQARPGHGLWLDFVVDGTPITGQYEDILSMSASDLAYVELVEPSDSRCSLHDTPYGYVEIRHKMFQKEGELPSEGVTIFPQGLAVSAGTYVQAPQNPGDYHVLIDLISPDRTVRSFERSVKYVK